MNRLTVALTVIPYLCAAAMSKDPDSPIKRDEEVLFYPTFARQDDDGRSWLAAIHGSIFEPEEGSLKRALLVRLLREGIPRKLSEEEERIFNRRVRLFLVDSERGKAISIRLGSAVHRAGTSGAGGHFRGEVRLSDEQMSALRGVNPGDDGWVSFSAVTRPGDRRAFGGRFLPIGPEGLSVVSDIDDTIKLTNVRVRQELLANTFLRRFEDVPGMASTYQLLAEGKAAFHYVSASPWQLYPPLADFLRDAGFPPGTFHLKSVRLADSSVLNLVGSQEGYKTLEIEALLKAFPRLRVLLAGITLGEVTRLARVVRRRNVWLDVSWLDGVDCVRRALTATSASRLVFGSHSPFFYPDSALLKIAESRLSAAEQRAICCGNAKRLFRL